MTKFVSLTAQQKAFWDLEKFIGGSSCNICGSPIFKGIYSPEKIKEAISEHYRINEIWRIRIKNENGVISQYVSDCETNNIQIISLKNMEELDEYAKKWAKEPINLNGQLYEMRGVVSPGQCGLLCKMHHMVGDAWSIALACNQISKILNNEIPETYSYIDYVNAENEYRKSSRYDDDRMFFEECFKRCSQPLFLQNKTANSFVANRKAFIINKRDKSHLLQYVKRENTSLFVLFLTALSAYFSRIKMNVTNFYIGTTFLNRSGYAEKNTLGLFVNTVPILVELNNSKTFVENLASIKSSSWGTLRHHKYNYAELLGNLRLNYNFQGKLYDVMINYENTVLEGFISSKWYFNGMQTETLMIQINDRMQEGVLNIFYDYLTEIFTENDIEKIHASIMHLLEDAIRNPDKKIGELEIAPEEELSILRGEKTVLPESETIPSLFEETATKKAVETCIVTDDKNYTFAEFNALVKLIDSEIRKITHGKRQTIALIAERSIEMYVSIYAIVRGGNTYLPIDPAYPEERIGYMLEDSGTKLVLAQDKFCSLFDKIRVLNVSEIMRGGKAPTDNLPVSALPEDTTYTIYTSGSTGRPKVAKVSHRSLLNRIMWMDKAYPLDENSVILQKTSFTFDVSLWEIFWWGVAGGKMAFMKPNEHFLPAKITDEIYRKKATVAHFVPSVLDLFIKYLENNPDEREKVTTLKNLFVSGEVLNAALINRFYAMFSTENVKTHNLYGPAECAVDVTFYDCKAQESDPLPIGRPIDNTNIFILDNNMQAVPKGVVGEVCIGGANVGQGYVNNEELTNEVFLKNPFGEGKIYKTGDLGYINSENEIIFSGRKDSQIKLNGQRIELAEIENAISEIAGITLAAVIASKNIEGNQILCAFYSGEKKENTEIRNELGKKLPHYMIPQIITHLNAMPLTSSGKIDKLSLPKTDLENIVSDKEFIDARTEEEKALVDFERTAEENITCNKDYEKSEFFPPERDIEQMVCDKFSEILHISPVSMNTDFFFAGGSSIDVISFISDKRFKNISAPEFISNPTPAGICAVLENKKNNKYEYLQSLFVPETSKKNLLLFPYAGGSAESYSELVPELRKRMPETALYFVRFLHSAEECRGASEEIEDLKNSGSLYFYAHCIGDAVALQTIDFIEKNQGEIGGLIVGANIPPEKPLKYNCWNVVPDFVLKKVLIKAGSRIGDLSDSQSKEILCLFRKDADFFSDFFKSRIKKISAPISVIINKKDIFTPNHKDAAKNWQKYTAGEVSVQYIKSDSHYFQSRNAADLAEMIAQIVDLPSRNLKKNEYNTAVLL